MKANMKRVSNPPTSFRQLKGNVPGAHTGKVESKSRAKRMAAQGHSIASGSPTKACT